MENKIERVLSSTDVLSIDLLVLNIPSANLCAFTVECITINKYVRKIYFCDQNFLNSHQQ